MSIVQNLLDHTIKAGLRNVVASVADHAPSIPKELRQKLIDLLGDSRFSDEAQTKSRFSKTTLPTSTTPLGVVWPRNKHEVSSLLVLLAQHGIPWHAISRGKNWGYGDACAPLSGCFIIDLRQMDSIVEINEELGFAVIEPGVTQGQLADELVARGSRLMLDVTGAGPDASIVGNVLQRGFGHTPYGDRTAASCNYEAVFPNGEIRYTGFGAETKTNIGHVYPYGQGPNFQGMLAQNNAAVVTRMTIWLQPRPEKVDGFSFQVDDSETFSKIIDQIGLLRQNGTIDSVVHLANDLRVVSSQPWMEDYSTSEGPFLPDQRLEFCRRAGISSWNGLGGIYGSRRVVAAKKKDIRDALSGLCKVRFFSKSLIRTMKFASQCLPQFGPVVRLGNLTNAVTDVYDLLNGKPSPSHLEGAFYRNRPKSGKVIDAGLIWIAPVVPFTGNEALSLTEALEAIANQHGFDLPVTISPVVPRAAVCIANISYDQSDQAQKEQAACCYRAIQNKISSLGYASYRSSSVRI